MRAQPHPCNTQHVNLSCVQPVPPNLPHSHCTSCGIAAEQLCAEAEQLCTHDAVLSPDADAPPLGRQIVRLRSRKCCGGREEEKKEPDRARERGALCRAGKEERLPTDHA